MKTLFTLILIPLILMGPYTAKLFMFMAESEAIEGVAKQHAIKIQSIDQKADLLVAFFITVAFICAYLIFRFTFGHNFSAKLTLPRYCLLALSPTILFALTFFIKSPADILEIFSSEFGRTALGIIFGISFIYGIITHFLSSLVAQN